jgi:uncharacterized membrane protein
MLFDIYKEDYEAKSKILLYSGDLWFLGEGMFGPLFAIYSQKIGGTIIDITRSWAIYLIIMGIFVMYVGKMSDRKYKKEYLLLAGYI